MFELMVEIMIHDSWQDRKVKLAVSSKTAILGFKQRGFNPAS